MKWNKFHLDTAKNLPLYQLLADQLRQKILTGVLAPGEKLPDSRELQKLLHLSAVTIENGLNILTKEQFLLRRPRCGTFVAETLPGMATGMLEPPGCIYAVLSNLKGLVGSYWWISFRAGTAVAQGGISALHPPARGGFPVAGRVAALQGLYRAASLRIQLPPACGKSQGGQYTRCADRRVG